MLDLIEKVYIKSQKKITKRYNRIKTKDNAVRWGIIGLGNMAHRFSEAIDSSSNSKIVGVASRSINKAEKFASRYNNCKAYGSYEDMLNDNTLDIDIVYIATPTKYHFDNILLCLNANKNVLCEKPITSCYDEAEKLYSIAYEKKLVLLEGMWMKCLPTYSKAKEWIKNGEIGEIELIKADLNKREIIDTKLSIFSKDEGGGVLKDFGVYAIAFMIGITGNKPKIINSICRKSSFSIDSDWHIHMKDNNIDMVINLSANFGSLSKAAIIGKSGCIEFDSPFNRTNKVSLYNIKGELIKVYKQKYLFEGFEYEIDEVNRIFNDDRFYSDKLSARETLITQEILDDLYINLK